VAKKEKLRVSNFEDFGNILLYTIASSETDIHLCLLINRIFKISLSLSDDIVLLSKQGPAVFRKYEFENGGENEKFILALNRDNSGNYLLPEFKKIDFVFMIISEMPGTTYQISVQGLKAESAITAIYKIDPLSVKSFGKIKL
jgi:hypothetical protein